MLRTAYPLRSPHCFFADAGQTSETKTLFSHALHNGALLHLPLHSRRRGQTQVLSTQPRECSRKASLDQTLSRRPTAATILASVVHPEILAEQQYHRHLHMLCLPVRCDRRTDCARTPPE